jgi:hypothetical protein
MNYNGHNWENILVLWFCVFITAAIVAVWAHDGFSTHAATGVVMAITIIGSELVGRH